MSVAEREAIARRYVEALTNQDLDAIRSLYAEDARVEDPIGAAPIVGIDAILAFYQKVAFRPMLTYELTGPICCPENAVAFSFRVSATGAGEGGPGSMDIIDVFELDSEGRVVSMKAYWTPF